MDNDHCPLTGYVAVNAFILCTTRQSINIKNNEVARDEQPQPRRSLFVVSNSRS